MTTCGSLPKLLWPSSTRIQYVDVPHWVEESLKTSFPRVNVVIARDEETLYREIEDCEIFVSGNLKPEQFARCRKLKWIHSPAAGVGQLLSPALVESDVVVTNARTVHAVPVAEHAIALLLALARRLPDCFRYQAEAVWGHNEIHHGRYLPTEINGKTLGLVGLGCIGREVAVRAKVLGMRVVAVKQNPSPCSEFADRIYSPQHLADMLSKVDYVVVAAPDTPETRHMIGEKELHRMKPAAFIVNISRGSLVDTEALRRALESGAIAGAALDVTEPEPLPPGHPLWRAPNILIAHHLGGATDRFWPRQADLLTENLRRYLAGEPLLNPVDKRRGY